MLALFPPRWVAILLAGSLVAGGAVYFSQAPGAQAWASCTSRPAGTNGLFAWPSTVTGLSALTISTMSAPAYLTPTADPSFANTVTRVSDQTAFGVGTQTHLDHDYSLIEPWNADCSLLLLHSGAETPFNTMYLLNGQTGAYLRTLVTPDSEHTDRWDAYNPDNLYSVDNSGSGNGGTVCAGGGNDSNQMTVIHPKSNSATSPTVTVIHTFSQFDCAATMSFGLDKGDFSLDGNTGAVMGWSSSAHTGSDGPLVTGQTCASGCWGVVTFSISNHSAATPTITELGTLWLGGVGGSTHTSGGSSSLINLEVTAKGQGVLLEYGSTGTGAQGTGLWWYPITFSGANASGVYTLATNGSHYSQGLDTAGNEIMLAECGGCGVNTKSPTPKLVGVPLSSTGPCAVANCYITVLAASSPQVTNLHVSCRSAALRPGWCYVSDLVNSNTLAVGNEQIYAIAVDGSQQAQVWGFDHGSSNPGVANNTYTARAVPAPDGRRVLFDSDWGAGTSSPSYDYILDWPQS